MPNWLLVLQTPTEKPANITKWLSEFGQEYEIIKAWKEKIPMTIEDYDGLIIMGGTMSANDVSKFRFLSEEIDLIKKWLESKKPLIGICLGAQLMAKALGKSVYVGEKPEIGWVPIHFSEKGVSDILFKDFAPTVNVFQWHYDTFELPKDVELLASSTLYQNQAFRLGKNAYALQFHPEVDHSLIKEWVEMHREKLIGIESSLDQKILKNTEEKLELFEKFGKNIVEKICRFAKSYAQNHI